MLITPEYVFQDVTHITPAFLAGKGITALVLDIDNTLSDDGSQQLPREVAAWLQAMRAAGVRLTIVSNGTPRRVAPSCLVPPLRRVMAVPRRHPQLFGGPAPPRRGGPRGHQRPADPDLGPDPLPQRGQKRPRGGPAERVISPCGQSMTNGSLPRAARRREPFWFRFGTGAVRSFCRPAWP